VNDRPAAIKSWGTNGAIFKLDCCKLHNWDAKKSTETWKTIVNQIKMEHSNVVNVAYQRKPTVNRRSRYGKPMISLIAIHIIAEVKKYNQDTVICGTPTS
jgi:hypothetical protein